MGGAALVGGWVIASGGALASLGRDGAAEGVVVVRSRGGHEAFGGMERSVENGT